MDGISLSYHQSILTFHSAFLTKVLGEPLPHGVAEEDTCFKPTFKIKIGTKEGFRESPAHDF